MAITRTPIIDDDGTGTTGTVIDNAWKTELYNQIDGLVGSAWETIPFNVANFWPGVTAGMVPKNYVSIVNKTMFWMLQIGGAPAPAPAVWGLPCVIPKGVSLYMGGAVLGGCAYLADGAGIGAGFVIASSGTAVTINKATGAQWSGSISAYQTLILALA